MTLYVVCLGRYSGDFVYEINNDVGEVWGVPVTEFWVFEELAWDTTVVEHVGECLGVFTGDCLVFFASDDDAVEVLAFGVVD